MLSKYNSASGDCYEVTEPTVAGARTLTFSEEQDGMWLSCQLGTSDRGNLTWGDPPDQDMVVEVDGIPMILNNNSLLEKKVTTLRLKINAFSPATYVWFRVVGVRNI